MATKKTIELDDAATWSVATEDFLAHLHRYEELMRENKSHEARQILETAFKSHEDATGQAALALVYFKLGIYPRALAIYRRLAEEHPGEPTLRLNLALVYLKTGQTDRAKDTLEELVGLHPSYRKAHGYLGLAFERLGNYVRAREAFEKAGASHMAERMARFTEPHEPPIEPPPASNETSSRLPTVPADLPTATKAADSGNHEPAIGAPVAAPGPVTGGSSTLQEPTPVSELASKIRMPRPLDSRFLISDSGYLLMDIASKGFTRLEGLRFLSGQGLSYKPAVRRSRGRDTEEMFGAAEDPLFEIEGSGRLGFHPRETCFSAISLQDDVAYIREDLVFAFDGELAYENGRMPSDQTMLVHFRGRGSLVLKTPTPPESLEVAPDRGVILPAGDLVGWFGRLLPRPTEASPFDPSLDALEISGEGVLLICLPQLSNNALT